MCFVPDTQSNWRAAKINNHAVEMVSQQSMSLTSTYWSLSENIRASYHAEGQSAKIDRPC